VRHFSTFAYFETQEPLVVQLRAICTLEDLLNSPSQIPFGGSSIWSLGFIDFNTQGKRTDGLVRRPLYIMFDAMTDSWDAAVALP
jgi:hypothetical protein